MVLFFFFKQKTAYEMRISDWSSDVCSSDLARNGKDRHETMTLLKKSRKMADFSEGGRPRGGRRRRGQPGDQPGLEREGDRPETQLPGGQRQIGEGQRRIQRLHRCGEGTMLLPRCAVLRAMLEIGRAACRARVCQYG